MHNLYTVASHIHKTLKTSGLKGRVKIVCVLLQTADFNSAFESSTGVRPLLECLYSVVSVYAMWFFPQNCCLEIYTCCACPLCIYRKLGRFCHRCLSAWRKISRSCPAPTMFSTAPDTSAGMTNQFTIFRISDILHSLLRSSSDVDTFLFIFISSVYTALSHVRFNMWSMRSTCSPHIPSVYHGKTKYFPRARINTGVSRGCAPYNS